LLVNALQDVLTIGGVPRQNLPPIVKRLKAWRERNGLSQRATSEVMHKAGVPIKLSTIQNWESGRNTPGELSSTVLRTFLDAHPVIEDPPKYGRWKGYQKPGG
jgi:hypothetical protein